MKIKELQDSIIQKIRLANDKELLNDLDQLLSDKLDQKPYKLPESKKRMLEESKSEFSAGDTNMADDVQAILLSRVLAISDEESLSEMIAMIDERDKTIYYTTPEQKEAIKEGQEQIANGQYFTNEQVEKEIDEWLNKK
ncbi:hypothetical protein [Roseimarinus sediminis]|uniref:hypothetical protein n=1 Tax=Roseimarinus sediminis TaxID=1610899 RepID=UPI003D244AEF